MESLLIQLLNGLASASTLFLMASGLSLIFGVSRIVNFAHGSFYMLGLYLACTSAAWLGTKFPSQDGLAFWAAVLLSGLFVGGLGYLIERGILRRIYAAPELMQLLASFALVLIIRDAALAIFGAEDLLGPRAPGLTGYISIFDRRFPVYDLMLIAIGPLVLALLWALIRYSHWGLCVRAASEDRDMCALLGVNQPALMASVFALGAALAALAGALQMPREPAHLALDLQVVGDAFVVVVVGGLGSIPGAFLASLCIGMTKALCAWAGTVTWFGIEFALPKLTLVVEFLIMALVLIIRPWGLMGKALSLPRLVHRPETAPRPLSRLQLSILFVGIVLTGLAIGFSGPKDYGIVLVIDIMLMIMLAASLHWMMSAAGLHSFGHAAYFGAGAYAAALLSLKLKWGFLASVLLAPWIAATLAMLFASACIRLSGVYLAMLTLAFAQIVWSVIFQWDDFAGGSNGLVGIWPEGIFAERRVFAYFVLFLLIISFYIIRCMHRSYWALALRAARDAPLRFQAQGLAKEPLQWFAFVSAAWLAGLAGALFAFSKGSIAPDLLSISRSVDILVMVLLGGLQSVWGPLWGALSLTVLQDWLARDWDYWRGVLGLMLLGLVLLWPGGLSAFRLVNPFVARR
ncbi:MAG: ABC transporter permease [Betaproteobacteria bacterium]|jgi:branched-chain amino acid transport system permease protein|nr:ABC transporter permease [Betaproteobacteria bacterium]NBQ94801.1 ABC transporter permease [Betaproteobacteria bacterium]NBS38235.1 ABC transporter permease [Betaproteobacteria bacterium]NBT81133.1 ABC transporter permease [Betaproteobacteria bacterium]NBY55391.1 ABC transporter permease [Betaproteobacteria bacterium]